VGTKTKAICIDQESNRIYATSPDEDKVVVIDGVDNEVLDELDVGSGPRDICALEATHRVYVINGRSDDISIIDGITGQVSDPLLVGGTPHSVDAWEEGRRVYVSCPSTGVILVLQDEFTKADEFRSSEKVPFLFQLDQNYPNPFNSSTHIPFSLLREDLSDVSLRVYNLLGQVVRQLVIPPLEDGRGMVTWDGRDDAGKLVASGLYLCRLEVGSLRRIRKLVLLR
jgi:YVTN family beta-propeller protein